MGFSEKHRRFRNKLRRFIQQEIVPNIEEWEDKEEIPRELYRKMGQSGFLGIEYPRIYGGAEEDFWMTVVLAEELARCGSGGVAFSILVHTDMSSPWLTRLGTSVQKKQFIPSITSGDTVCALAITEPDVGSDMANLKTTAYRDGNDWIINGTKTFITNGVHGDLYFVAARTRNEGPRHGKLSQFLVYRKTPGVTVVKQLKKTGMWAVDAAEIVLKDVRVPIDNLLGEEGRGFYQLAEGLQRERLVGATLSYSASQTALEDTLSYVQRREAFGRKLSEFQTLRHRIADITTEIEAARRLVYHAVSLFAAGEECTKEVSMAKLFATEIANRVAYETVQLHGGIGYLRDSAVERFSRDYRLWTIAAGTSEMMREIISKHSLT